MCACVCGQRMPCGASVSQSAAGMRRVAVAAWQRGRVGPVIGRTIELTAPCVQMPYIFLLLPPLAACAFRRANGAQSGPSCAAVVRACLFKLPCRDSGHCRHPSIPLQPPLLGGQARLPIHPIPNDLKRPLPQRPNVGSANQKKESQTPAVVGHPTTVIVRGYNHACCLRSKMEETNRRTSPIHHSLPPTPI